MPAVPATPRVRAALVLLLLVGAAAGFAAPAGAAEPPTSLIVGFHEPAVNLTLLQSTGATVTGAVEALGLAEILAADPDAVAALLLLHPAVAFVEANGATAGDSTGWDSTGWDSTGWDSTGWDATWNSSTGWDGSTGWDSTGWDSTGWDSTGWDSTGWDSTGWDGSTGWDSTGWDSTGWDANIWNGTHLTAKGAGDGTKDPLFGFQWGLRAANVSLAAASSAGAKTLCVLDSGVDASHPDLRDRMWRDPETGAHGRDFVHDDADPTDDAGHGTHVAGIAAAALGNGLGTAGASSARILAVKVLAADGTGTEFDLAQGLHHCVAKGAHVASMSLGTPEDSPAVRRAVSWANAQGVALVASVGNTGGCLDCVRYPAAYPQVMAVGAALPTGEPAPFSAVTRAVDISAPGYAIVSTLPGERYGAASGTSQATPFVSAALLVLLDAESGMKHHQAMNLLRRGAVDVGHPGPDPYHGHGLLNVGRALALA